MECMFAWQFDSISLIFLTNSTFLGETGFFHFVDLINADRVFSFILILENNESQDWSIDSVSSHDWEAIHTHHHLIEHTHHIKWVSKSKET